MSHPSGRSDLFSLNNTAGRAFGPDAVEMANFNRLVVALLRIGVAFTVTVDQHGNAEVVVPRELV